MSKKLSGKQKAQLSAVKSLIEAEEYKEAMRLVKMVEHPIAREWEKKLSGKQKAQKSDPMVKHSTAHERGKRLSKKMKFSGGSSGRGCKIAILKVTLFMVVLFFVLLLIPFPESTLPTPRIRTSPIPTNISKKDKIRPQVKEFFDTEKDTIFENARINCMFEKNRYAIYRDCIETYVRDVGYIIDVTEVEADETIIYTWDFDYEYWKNKF